MRHEFVEFIPEKPDEGVLYISIPYKTTLHLCACGCKREVFTSLSPAGWKLIFDGETVSLDPSIGNWDFPCQSHYFIKKGKVKWSYGFSDEQIREVKERDLEDKEQYYRAKEEVEIQISHSPWARIVRYFFKRNK
ncbi:hypothetical protein LOH54_01150 [Sulfurimonas sp. HSL-3221]|uniref:DUF6527 family protein n=1 Tax=Sulfurimonadaceae TaxID=2771471 RepID=UPI001E4F08E4|nr:DUF6527 family protein [Sulfurimonas sp. HSL-3221]UFS62748.1 hypothetical protein LOH54_01150 [Sulfurimonas sp. HSL-3221]